MKNFIQEVKLALYLSSFGDQWRWKVERYGLAIFFMLQGMHYVTSSKFHLRRLLLSGFINLAEIKLEIITHVMERAENC